jgi:hypothetical protein
MGPDPRVEDDEIRLAIALASSALGLPADVMQDDPAIRKPTESGSDPAFGVLSRVIRPQSDIFSHLRTR